MEIREQYLFSAKAPMTCLVLEGVGPTLSTGIDPLPLSRCSPPRLPHPPMFLQLLLSLNQHLLLQKINSSYMNFGERNEAFCRILDYLSNPKEITDEQASDGGGTRQRRVRNKVQGIFLSQHHLSTKQVATWDQP